MSTGRRPRFLCCVKYDRVLRSWSCRAARTSRCSPCSSPRSPRSAGWSRSDRIRNRADGSRRREDRPSASHTGRSSCRGIPPRRECRSSSPRPGCKEARSVRIGVDVDHPIAGVAKLCELRGELGAGQIAEGSPTLVELIVDEARRSGRGQPRAENAEATIVFATRIDLPP